MDRLNPEDHPSLQQSDESVKRAFSMGYGRWLTPLIEKDDVYGRCILDPESSSSNPEASSSNQEPEPPRISTRRGRGRPRVNAPRDTSAIEKRRAQVRNAQRTYQKRKDNATSSVNNRCDDLLEVLSDLSTEVEELLRISSKAGLMNQRSELAIQIQRLWATYDEVLNRLAVSPELRLLKVKNDRRKAEHAATDGLQIGVIPPQDALPARSSMPIPPYLSDVLPTLQSLSFDQSCFSAKDIENVDMSAYQNSEITLIQTLSHTSSTAINKRNEGRTLLDIVKQRQAQLKASERSMGSEMNHTLGD